MYQCTLEECVVKVVKENRAEKFRTKTTYTSKGPDVTLRNTWGHKNSDFSSMPREIERVLQTWSLDPIPSESRNWPDEELQGQTQYMQRIEEFKYDAQLEQKHHFITKEFINKSQ